MPTTTKASMYFFLFCWVLFDTQRQVLMIAPHTHRCRIQITGLKQRLLKKSFRPRHPKDVCDKGHRHILCELAWAWTKAKSHEMACQQLNKRPDPLYPLGCVADQFHRRRPAKESGAMNPRQPSRLLLNCCRFLVVGYQEQPSAISSQLSALTKSATICVICGFT